MNKTGPRQAGAAPPSAPPESREMFTEITSLMASLAKALGLTEAETATAVEQGQVTLNLAKDTNGNPYIAATHNGITARVYQGAIKRETGAKP